MKILIGRGQAPQSVLSTCGQSIHASQDGWNRSKFGPIEKFIMYYENIEREKVVAPVSI